MRKRGELPNEIKKQFVEDLLSRDQCICGRSLGHDAADARQVVEGWRSRAGLVDVEEKVIRMGGEVHQLQMQTSLFWEHLDSSQERRRADRQELSRIEDDLDEISQQLRQSAVEELGQLEEKLVATKKDIGERSPGAGGVQRQHQTPPGAAARVGGQYRAIPGERSEAAIGAAEAKCRARSY